MATQLIPRGTITWARDALDQTISRQQARELDVLFNSSFHKYTYVIRTGEYLLCWDHARFMNHSCDPNCIAPGFDLEIAVRDIQPGEQLTGDYATYNLEAGFDCLCDASDCRGRIELTDRYKLVDSWDAQTREALMLLKTVDQPLWPLVRERAEVEAALAGRSTFPSPRLHFFEPNDSQRR